MTLSEYLEAVKTYLLTNTLVENFQVIRERMTVTDGYLRIKMILSGNYSMEFSEYLQQSSDSIKVITYSYHCEDADGHLIVRWDNTPHFPDLPGFPHHKHIGSPVSVKPGHPIDIFIVLNEIGQFVSHNQSSK